MRRDGNARTFDFKFAVLAVFDLLFSLALGFAVASDISGGAGQGEAGFMLWGVLCGALALIPPLCLATLRPVLTRLAPELDGPRTVRLVYMMIFVGFVFSLPGWFWFIPLPGIGLWQGLALHLGFSIGVLLILRFISLPFMWNFLLTQSEDSDATFIGSPRDDFWRPEYYSQDLRWVLGLPFVRRNSVHTEGPQALREESSPDA